MGTPATLRVNIVGDSRGVGSAVAETERGLARLGTAWRNAAAGVAIASTTVLLAGAAAIKNLGSAAATAEQNIGALEAVFKEQSAAAKAYAKDAASAVGLSRSAYAQIAALVGGQLKSAGVPMAELASQTDRLVKLGADLAAQYGGSTKQAMEAMSSLFRGEADPIERYNVRINQTAVNAELAARGQSKLTGAARAAAEQQARIKLLYEQTADAQGAFNREAGTAQGRWERLTARWDDAKVSLGEKLLPALEKGADLLGKLITAIEDHPDVFTGLAIGIGVAAAAMWALSIATTVATGGLNLVIVAIAAAVAALAGVGIYLYNNFEPVRVIIDKVVKVGKAFVEGFMDKAREGWKKLQPDLEALKRKFDELWTKLQPLVRELEPWARRFGQFMGTTFIYGLKGAIIIIGTIIDGIGRWIDRINWLIGVLQRIRWPRPPSWLIKLLDRGGSLFSSFGFGGFAFDPRGGDGTAGLLRAMPRLSAAQAAAAGAPQVVVNVYVDDPRLKDLIRIEVDGAQTTLARRILAGRAL